MVLVQSATSATYLHTDQNNIHKDELLIEGSNEKLDLEKPQELATVHWV